MSAMLTLLSKHVSMVSLIVEKERCCIVRRIKSRSMSTKRDVLVEYCKDKNDTEHDKRHLAEFKSLLTQSAQWTLGVT